MTRPLPDHGTRARYLRGCSCTACADASFRYMKNQRLFVHANGHGLRVDPAPVRARIQYWKDRGYGHAQIADAAGVSRRIIDAHAKGAHPAINPASARKILAAHVGKHNVSDYLPIDAAGTRRRLQALMVIGHPLNRIAAQTGHHSESLGRIANGHYGQVRPGTAEDIATLYERWQDTPGACVRTKKRAAKEGWNGPDAWGDDIDNPDAVPVIRQASNAQLAGERRVEALHLADAGVALQEVAERVGLTVPYVRTIIRDERPVLYRHWLATSIKSNGTRSAA